MSTAETSRSDDLYGMITGYYLSQAIHVVARLGIADLLAPGPCSAEELAQRSRTHGLSLRRVLRLLVTAGLFTEDDAGRFALTPTGNQLRAGVPGSMRATALLFGGITQRAWVDLLHSVTTGEPAFRHAFGMEPFASWPTTPRRPPISMRRWLVLPHKSPATAPRLTTSRHAGW
jgi:Dimerisation domain